MDIDADRPALPRARTLHIARLLLLAFISAAAALVFALFAASDAHASDDDPGLLDSLTATVEAVEDPLAQVVTTTVDTTVNGAVGAVSSTVGTVAPAVSPVTEPVVTAVTQPTVAVVTAVVDARPVTTTTTAVVNTTSRVIDTVPVVNEIVDELPGIPDIVGPLDLPPLVLDPEPLSPDVAGPDFATPDAVTDVSTNDVSSAAVAVGSAFSAPFMATDDLAVQHTAAAPGEFNLSTPAESAPTHPSTPVAAPASSSGSGSTSSGQHSAAADLVTHAVNPPLVAVGALSSNEAVPSSPTADSDCSPD